MKVVVVGAGIIGACAAFELARAGAEVVLMEAGTPGGEASATSYAWLNSNSFDDPAYHALRVLGMAAYRDLAAELGTSEWLHLTGNTRVAVGDDDAENLRERVARKRAAGYPAELLSPADAVRAEPALARLPGKPSAVAYFASEGYVDTTTLVGDLLFGFAALGGEFVRARVESLLPDGRGVRTDGSYVTADRVVLCTGADTSVLRGAGFSLPAMGPAGATVITAPVPVRMSGLIHFPDLTIRPDGGGRLLLHAEDIDQRVAAGPPRLDETSAGELTGRVRRWLGLENTGVGISEVRVSRRPYPPDGYPVVGPVPGISGAYVTCTHSGVTLAAILGRLAAMEILTGSVEPLLAPYRPNRPAITG
jgi:glycine/D-amino acid oxidase-like deaminating enzyme